MAVGLQEPPAQSLPATGVALGAQVGLALQVDLVLTPFSTGVELRRLHSQVAPVQHSAARRIQGALAQQEAVIPA